MSQTICFRPPVPEDACAVSQLLERCPPLDQNSLYCTLLQCSHFSNTSVIALDEKASPAGFVSGYRVPDRPNTLFVWQIAVSKSQRGQGLAGAMIEQILQRDACRSVVFIETTVTESNTRSLALFQRLAHELDANHDRSELFNSARHFNATHESEFLVRIGPFKVLPQSIVDTSTAKAKLIYNAQIDPRRSNENF